ncbi:hypothetical protein PFMALIP_06279, partial [Plasmodium falciparum MaliPS096_E11]
MVKKFCRQGKNGNKIYCSGDGFDCTKTIRAKYIYAIGDECTKCSFWCGFYEKWIDNQKKEFLKQKQKYDKEISGSSRKKRSTSNNNYKGYDEEFYEILKSNNVGGLDKFLQLLKEENECKGFKEDQGIIDFTKHDNKNNDQKGTFYRSKYCEECPQCGVEKGNNGNEWKDKDESGECKGGKRYEIPEDTKYNVIPVLSFGDKRDEIKSKIGTFCNQRSDSSGDCGTNIDSSLCEKWKCYKEDDIKKHFEEDLEYHKEVKGAGGLCILEKTNGEEKVNKQKTFNDFFYFWVGRLLNDSIEWREKLGKCLKNGTKIKCKNGCNKNCKCYESWVNRKRNEWHEIKKHFNTQDFGKEALFGEFRPYYVIETVLEDSFLEDITKAYGDARAIQGIKNMLEEKKKERGADTSKDKTIIDYLLDHEKKEAQKCTSIHNEENCEDPKPKPAEGGAGRSERQPEDSPPPPVEEDFEEEEEDEDEDEDHAPEEEKEEKKEEPAKKKGSSEDTTPSVDVCAIVNGALTQENLQAACPTKYGPGGKERYSQWKCIPSGKP